MKAIEEVGNRYGKLTVLKRGIPVRYPSGQLKVTWECICDCGKTHTTFAQNLRGGTTKSCGCLKLECEDYLNRDVGLLKVISRVENSNPPRWNCKCSCGNEIIKDSHFLSKAVENSSCGCYKYPRKAKHGHTINFDQSPTYSSWWSMIQRCLTPTNSQYDLYGGSGVKVCERWNIKANGSFENFLEDMGERPEGTSLNRINSVSLYSKDTCEWATLSVQAYDQKKRCTNTSGRTGISLNKATGLWEAYIDKNYKRIRLGFHKDFNSAVKVREDAELLYFGFIKQ